ncbi:unnamed protein product [Clavelina lepadiformis]|uniref:Long-chain-fatty-acid--CoA ligase n=1 Tax=Clavelina lepadiformis TaxID=159417 RepID=A0ABP0F3A6_CLALP
MAPELKEEKLDQSEDERSNPSYEPIPLDELAKKQSVTIEGSECIRRSPMLTTDQPIAFMEKETRTLHDVFLRGLKRSNGRPCVGWRPGPKEPFKWLTYREVLDRAKNFGSGLVAKGAKANTSQLVGIFAQNRVEWKIAEQACNSYSMVIVPLYDTLGPQSVQYIITQCGLKLIVIDVNSKAKTLLNACKEGTYCLAILVMMEEPNDEVKRLAVETNVKIFTFDEMENIGKDEPHDFVPPSADDLHTICYTSGTTGFPKGVMLTHANVIADHAGVLAAGEETYINFSSEDVYISYLPLAHVFERLMAVAMYYEGARVGFFQGDIKLLTDDIIALRPTVMAMVPRLINRIYDKIWAGASQSLIKNFLLNRAVKSKSEKLSNGVTTKNSFWDKIVFRKIQNTLGGRLRVCVTGAAPVSPDILNFMRCALGIPFTEAYGQTESSSGICASCPGDYNTGSVGGPVLCNLVKLVDVPDKNYFAKDGKGEICAKGPNVFIGYYKDEEKTKETLDEEGWLHTGDVGMWLPNGSLKIIDRKKHIFKLSQGEYIAPEKIEGILLESPAVSQVFLYGESLKSAVVLVAVPDPESFEKWCSEKGVGSGAKYEDLCSNEQVNQLVLEDMRSFGKFRGLKSFELPAKLYLSSELFTIESELLTPTLKNRRPQIYARYQEEIAEMYKDLN